MSGEKRLMITAMESGAGKTVLTCALLTALRRRGLRVRAAKCGPDYIDPMFHRRAAGGSCYNLDLFLQGEEGVRKTLACRADAPTDLLVVEGAMGFYDGAAGTDEASAWHLAALARLPAVLALRPRGSSLTLAAQVRGLRDFRAPSQLRGIFLTACSPSLFSHLGPLLERETGLPVLGYLPPLDEAALPGRHLGLCTAGEIADLDARLSVLAGALERGGVPDRFLALAAETPPEENAAAPSAGGGGLPGTGEPCRIAVARDEAFCFLYDENLAALREAGATLVFFSPLRDPALPPGIGGLYLPGGYPELHAEALAENAGMRGSVRAAVAAGLPTAAECGGFLYLQEALTDDRGLTFPMAGALPGRGADTGRLTRFGYTTLTAAEDSLLFRRGERLPVHEFHHWDSTHPGKAFLAQKPNGAVWRCGWAGPTLYAGFPHLHFGGPLPLARRLVSAARGFGAGSARGDNPGQTEETF